jgi:hypothetical protein
MNYSLGNMLGGGGSLNPDGLSLDLQFATDKTLTARKGPTPVFTRASTATFVGSDGLIQSAAINAARFDHDPVTLACKGLLMEESRTNLVFPSDTLTTQTRTVTAVAHTLSFYGTGTVVLSGAHAATVIGTGAYPTRTTLTFTPSAGSLTLTVTGTVTEAQLEAGAFATSYIPTTTASVVRSADVCSITGGDFTGFYNQSEGTLFANIQSTGTGDRRPVAFDIGNNSQFYNFYATSTLSRYAQANGSLGSFTMAGTVPSTPLLYAGTLKHGDYSLALNGSIVGSSAVSIGATFTTLRIGAGGGGGGQFLCGHIQAIRYYKKRLANAKLQSLTT